MDMTAPFPRSGRVRAGAGWLGLALTLGCVTLAVSLTVVDRRSLLADDVALSCVIGVGASLVAAFILTRHPGNGIGWLFAVTGLSRAIAGAATAWCLHAVVVRPGSLPAGAFASWLQAWTALPALGLAPLTVVLFPDGQLPGRRWRAVPVLAGVVVALFAVVVPIGMWPYRGVRLLPDAPVPDTTDAKAVNAAMGLAAVLTVVVTVLALASLLVRLRGADREVRQQIKWFGFGAVCALAANLLALASGVPALRLVGVVAVLSGIGLGVFRYRLYDVDRLIKRTLVYGLVTAALIGAFAALDVTLAAIVGQRSVPVAAVSAFVVALLSRPARERAQDLVDRAFDRRTHDAVAILRDLSRLVGREPVEPAAILAALRRALRDPGLQVYFAVHEGKTLTDEHGRTAAPVPVAAGQVTDPVTRAGQPIAVLVHNPVDPVLLAAVTRAAATVLEHGRLQAELQVQLAQVRESRARLVTAGDAERRRIERDLHDGAQQRLVGLALHLQTAKRRPGLAPQTTELLSFTVEQLHAGLEDIRRLVHDILPPALADGGLRAALAELARPGQVSITCADIGRVDQSIEVTAWLVACEAVANAAKHAPGHPVSVQVSRTEETVLMRISDDGPGGADPAGDGLRNLADRVAAHGGRLTVDSPAGAGTRLVAELPCAS
jgi:signal transduction histidine kinase